MLIKVHNVRCVQSWWCVCLQGMALERRKMTGTWKRGLKEDRYVTLATHGTWVSLKAERILQQQVFATAIVEGNILSSNLYVRQIPQPRQVEKKGGGWIETFLKIADRNS